MLQPLDVRTFRSINRGYDRVFRPGGLTVGLVVPIETYSNGPVPSMTRHLERVQLAEETRLRRRLVARCPVQRCVVRRCRSGLRPVRLPGTAHRRRVLVQLNKGESLHALRQDLFCANRGQIRRRNTDDQDVQGECLTLLTTLSCAPCRRHRSPPPDRTCDHRRTDPAPLTSRTRTHQPLRPLRLPHTQPTRPRTTPTPTNLKRWILSIYYGHPKKGTNRIAGLKKVLGSSGADPADGSTGT
jgi:hypothetical protein